VTVPIGYACCPTGTLWLSGPKSPASASTKAANAAKPNMPFTKFNILFIFMPSSQQKAPRQGSASMLPATLALGKQ
jgi:hypothetical protein